MKRRSLLHAMSAAAAVGTPSLVWAQRTEIAVGLTLPGTGPQAEVAIDLLAGYEVALKSRGVDLIVLDDKFKPETTAANVKLLAANRNIVAISGLVGTPNASVAIPVARELGMPIVGLRSGAQNLRDGKDGVLHLRSSFDSEIVKIVSVSKNSGSKGLVVIHTNDPFGIWARDAMLVANKEQGQPDPLVLSLDRELGNLAAVGKEAQQFLASPQGAGYGVALLMIAKPMTELVNVLRLQHKLISPMYAMSFTGTRAISEKKDDALRGLGLVSAFPLPRDISFRLSKTFLAEIEQQKRMDLANSLTAIEGWFYGAVLRAAISRGATRKSMMETMLKAPLDIGGQEIAFDSSKVGYRYLHIFHKHQDGRLVA